jgi:hypothetical protein
MYECTAAALPERPYSPPLTDVTEDMDGYSLPDASMPPFDSYRIIPTNYNRDLAQNKAFVAQRSHQMNEEWMENQRDAAEQGIIVTDADDLAEKVSLANIFIQFY